MRRRPKLFIFLWVESHMSQVEKFTVLHRLVKEKNSTRKNEIIFNHRPLKGF